MAKVAELRISEIRWDNGGWYVAISDDDGVIDDSQKVWFEVDVDYYEPDEEKELIQAVKKAYKIK